MRNLKRVLSLTLASVMLLGMMVVGAGAADYSDVDYAKDNVEAIEVLQAIDVMTGDRDSSGNLTGTFRPGDPVSRGEMARVMAALMDLDYDYYIGVNPFNDMVGHWAEGYVAACYANGIIAGRSATTYDPGATVTTVEAAAMLMRALGYFQTAADTADGGFEVATVRQGGKIDLFNGVNTKTNDPLTRNDVAQLVLNTLKSGMVELDSSSRVDVTIGDAQVSVGGSKYNFVTKADSYAYAIDDKTANNDGEYVEGSIVELGEKLYQGDLKMFKDNETDAFGRPAVRWTYKTQEVGVYVDYPTVYKSWTAKVGKNQMYSLLGSSNVSKLLTGNDPDYNSLSIWKDGEEITGITRDNANAVKDLYTYIDRDDTGASGGDYGAGKGVLTEVFQDSKNNVTITFTGTYLMQATADYNASSDSVRVTVLTSPDKIFGTEAVTENVLSGEDFDGLADLGIKEDDYILYTYSFKDSDVQSIQKAEVLSGTVTAYQKSDKAFGKVGGYVSIDSKSHDYAKWAKEGAENGANVEYQVGVDASIVLDAYDYAIYVDDSSLAVGNYAYVAAIARESNLSTSTVADAFFTDGTRKTITVKNIYASDGQTKLDNGMTPGARWDDDEEIVDDQVDLVRGWYSYSRNSSDEYTLTKASTTGNFLSVADDDGMFKIEQDRVRIGGLVSGNKNTIFVLFNNNNRTVTVYTGVANVPDITNAEAYKAWYLHDKNKVENAVSAVFVDVTDASVRDGRNTLLYLIEKDKTEYNEAGGDPINTWKVVCVEDGEAAETKIQTTQNSSEWADREVYVSYGVNSDDRYDLNESDAFTYKAHERRHQTLSLEPEYYNQIVYSGDTLKLGGHAYLVNRDTAIALVMRPGYFNDDNEFKGNKGNTLSEEVIKDTDAGYKVEILTASQLANRFRNYTVNGEFWAVYDGAKNDLLESMIIEIIEVADARDEAYDNSTDTPMPNDEDDDDDDDGNNNKTVKLLAGSGADLDGDGTIDVDLTVKADKLAVGDSRTLTITPASGSLENGSWYKVDLDNDGYEEGLAYAANGKLTIKTPLFAYDLSTGLYLTITKVTERVSGQPGWGEVGIIVTIPGYDEGDGGLDPWPNIGVVTAERGGPVIMAKALRPRYKEGDCVEFTAANGKKIYMAVAKNGMLIAPVAVLEDYMAMVNTSSSLTAEETEAVDAAKKVGVNGSNKVNEVKFTIEQPKAKYAALPPTIETPNGMLKITQWYYIDGSKRVNLTMTNGLWIATADPAVYTYKFEYELVAAGNAKFDKDVGIDLDIVINDKNGEPVMEVKNDDARIEEDEVLKVTTPAEEDGDPIVDTGAPSVTVTIAAADGTTTADYSVNGLAASYAQGDPVSITITPAAGKVITDVTATGTTRPEKGADGSWTYTLSAITEDVTLTVTAEAVKTYPITVEVNNTDMGTASADVKEAAEGATVTITATPGDNYQVKEVTSDDVTVSATAPYTFTMPAKAVKVTVTFEAKTPTQPEPEVVESALMVRNYSIVGGYSLDLIEYDKDGKKVAVLTPARVAAALNKEELTNLDGKVMEFAADAEHIILKATGCKAISKDGDEVTLGVADGATGTKIYATQVYKVTYPGGYVFADASDSAGSGIDAEEITNITSTVDYLLNKNDLVKDAAVSVTSGKNDAKLSLDTNTAAATDTTLADKKDTEYVAAVKFHSWTGTNGQDGNDATAIVGYKAGKINGDSTASGTTNTSKELGVLNTVGADGLASPFAGTEEYAQVGATLYVTKGSGVEIDTTYVVKVEGKTVGYIAIGGETSTVTYYDANGSEVEDMLSFTVPSNASALTGGTDKELDFSAEKGNIAVPITLNGASLTGYTAEKKEAGPGDEVKYYVLNTTNGYVKDTYVVYENESHEYVLIGVSTDGGSNSGQDQTGKGSTVVVTATDIATAMSGFTTKPTKLDLYTAWQVASTDLWHETVPTGTQGYRNDWYIYREVKADGAQDDKPLPWGGFGYFLTKNAGKSENTAYVVAANFMTWMAKKGTTQAPGELIRSPFANQKVGSGIWKINVNGHIKADDFYALFEVGDKATHGRGAYSDIATDLKLNISAAIVAEQEVSVALQGVTMKGEIKDVEFANFIPEDVKDAEETKLSVAKTDLSATVTGSAQDWTITLKFKSNIDIDRPTGATPANDKTIGTAVINIKLDNGKGGTETCQLAVPVKITADGT